MANDMGQALDFDGTIEVADSEFEPVPEGVYDYEVVAVTREQFNGSAKMSACPVAKVEVKLIGWEREAHLFDRLFLNTKVAWRIARFFVSLGLREPGAGKDVPLKMDWSRTPGMRGRCKVTQRQHEGKTYNDVEFLEPEKRAPAQATVPTPPAVQAAVTQTFNQNGGF